MTLAFIAWNLSRRFIARIIFHTVRILQVVLCLSFESLLQSWCYGKISNLTYFGLPGKFSNDVERWAQVLLYFHLKNLHFAENMLFYPKNDVMAFLSDVHVYIKSNAVIWFWRYCHVRTRQTSENQFTAANVWCKQTHRWNGDGPTAGWVNLVVWLPYFSALCFHAFYSIRANFRKWFVSENMEPLSLRSIPRGVLINMLAIRYFFLYAWNWRINL